MYFWNSKSPSRYKSLELCNHAQPYPYCITHYSEITNRRLPKLKSEHTNLGCLKAANHSEKCEDFHHNSRLSVVIGSFKANVTRFVRKNLGDIEGRTRSIASLPVTTQNVWQPRFHEHIVKSRSTLNLIMQYIDNNIATWEHDCFNSNE